MSRNSLIVFAVIFAAVAPVIFLCAGVGTFFVLKGVVGKSQQAQAQQKASAQEQPAQEQPAQEQPGQQPRQAQQKEQPGRQPRKAAQRTIVGYWQEGEKPVVMGFGEKGEWGTVGPGTKISGTWKEIRPGVIHIDTDDEREIDVKYTLTGDDRLTLTFESGNKSVMRRRQKR